jgi:hypothetical protein
MKVLQVVDAVKVGHTTPPKATWVVTERDLVLDPVPHVLVQRPYLDQPETLQSIGQAKVLQFLFSAVDGQFTPPYAALVRTERVRRFVPVPQVFEHAA